MGNTPFYTDESFSNIFLYHRGVRSCIFCMSLCCELLCALKMYCVLTNTTATAAASIDVDTAFVVCDKQNASTIF